MKKLFVSMVFLTFLLAGCQHPVSPQIPSVEPPAPTETPRQTESPMPMLKITWEQIDSPPLGHGIYNLYVENSGSDITAFQLMGPANNGEATLYRVWKSTNGGKDWNETEKIILTVEQEKQSGFAPFSFGSGPGGTPNNPYLWLSQGEIVTGTPDPLTDFGSPHSVNEDPNNPGNIIVLVWYLPFDETTRTWGENNGVIYARLFLSLDGRWYEINFPPDFTSYDVYPETPLLTLVRWWLAPASVFRIISDDDGLVKVFMVNGNKIFSGKPIIKSPN